MMPRRSRQWSLERALFDARAKALEDRKDILRRRVQQLREEIAGLGSRPTFEVPRRSAPQQALSARVLPRRSRLALFRKIRIQCYLPFVASGVANPGERREARRETAVGKTPRPSLITA